MMHQVDGVKIPALLNPVSEDISSEQSVFPNRPQINFNQKVTHATGSTVALKHFLSTTSLEEAAGASKRMNTASNHVGYVPINSLPITH
jgi:hypothetical protein